jgi:WD40 repeat protein
VVNSVAFSPNGRFAVSGGGDETIKLWDVQAGKLHRSFSGADRIEVLAFSPDGRKVLTNGFAGPKLWGILTDKGLPTSFAGAVSDAAFSHRCAALSPDGLMGVSGGSFGQLILWDVTTGKQLRKFNTKEHDDFIAVAFSPDGKKVLSGSAQWLSGFDSHVFGQTLKLWDVATGDELRSFGNFIQPVESVAISPDGALALTGSADTPLRLWNIATGEEVHHFEGHSDTVWSVAFSPDGRFALSGSADKTLKLWDVSEWTQAPAASAAK